MERERFETMYAGGRPPWDIGRPQPEVERLERLGTIGARVLDAGCGTGENALYLTSRGHEVWGIDFVPDAIEQARAKARERGLEAHFEVGDALGLDRLGRTFDTVLDCGLFHTFDDDQRVRYVAGLAQVVRPGGAVVLLCISDQEPPGDGPRRISEQELRDAFRDGWDVREIRPTRFEATTGPDGPRFSPGGPKAWLAVIGRAAKG